MSLVVIVIYCSRMSLVVVIVIFIINYIINDSMGHVICIQYSARTPGSRSSRPVSSSTQVSPSVKHGGTQTEVAARDADTQTLLPMPLKERGTQISVETGELGCQTACSSRDVVMRRSDYNADCELLSQSNLDDLPPFVYIDVAEDAWVRSLHSHSEIRNSCNLFSACCFL